MDAERLEGAWLDAEIEYSLAELAELSGLGEAFLRELIDYGAIEPVDPAAATWKFTGACLATVRRACRLQASFELEPHGLALVISLLERIDALEDELGRLRGLLRGR